jgi:hypothetical protein
MKKVALSLLIDKGPIDISSTWTYVTVRGENTPSMSLKVNSVRANISNGDIEFLPDGRDSWISTKSCLYNTAPRIYDSVMYQSEQFHKVYVLN